MEIKIQSLESIHEAAREFIAAMGDNTVFALYGKMRILGGIIDDNSRFG